MNCFICSKKIRYYEEVSDEIKICHDCYSKYIICDYCKEDKTIFSVIDHNLKTTKKICEKCFNLNKHT